MKLATDKLPWIKVELSVTNIKTDECTEKTLYLYEGDWKDLQNYITSKKIHLTAEEMGKMFNYISKKFMEKVDIPPLSEEDKCKIADSFSKSKWFQKAFNELKDKDND